VGSFGKSSGEVKRKTLRIAVKHGEKHPEGRWDKVKNNIEDDDNPGGSPLQQPQKNRA